MTNGKLAIRKEADGRQLFHEIEGKTFVEQFEIYKNLYHNARFGETTDRLIQAILRLSVPNEKGEIIRGEAILKDKYTEKHEQLLIDLNSKKLKATTPTEKRLYGIFFNILREEYATVNDFKK